MVAFLLSLVLPGLGQFYNDELKKAVIVLCILGLAIVSLLTPLPTTPIGFLLIIIVAFGSYFYSVIQAPMAAHRIKSIRVHIYQRWYFLLLITIAWLVVLPDPSTTRPEFSIARYRVPTGSMEPTIQPGDWIVADQRYFRNHPVERGELVLCRYPLDSSYSYPRRCLAVGGDTVEFRDRVPYVNGNPIAVAGYNLGVWTPIVSKGTVVHGIYPPNAGNGDNYGPVEVPKGKYFLIGDNIADCYDSRYWGFVDLDAITSRPLFVYWSPRLSRIGTELK